jgi:hypothetical protein
MKSNHTLLGRHPLSDASYRNPNMMIREQGSGHHRLGDAPYQNSDMMISE